ncbi:hypothetical protein LQG66_07270 [Bradyrhizobium ontarionense]|uniref:Uncharacterized protein n=1 Tax=Bradyrhizobium ontarionense TaxID=2898149 RepID=A0ABY3RFL0_9BRAD|nr:hypothetical protein [Bradyrhizobium sp. A19]UFZ06096.1 hypothetical protein LQG66_07270 [Bradyrhizobium sp. A19]
MTDMLEPFWSETLMKCSRDFPVGRSFAARIRPAFKIAGGRKLAPAELNES